MDSDLHDLELSHLPMLKIAARELATAKPRARLSRGYLLDPRIPKAPRLPKALLREAIEYSDPNDPETDFRRVARESRGPRSKGPSRLARPRASTAAGEAVAPRSPSRIATPRKRSAKDGAKVAFATLLSFGLTFAAIVHAIR